MTSSLKAAVSPACAFATSSSSSAGAPAGSVPSVGEGLDEVIATSFIEKSGKSPTLEPAPPLGAVVAHQLDDAVADLKEPLVERAEAFLVERRVLAKLKRGLDRRGDRLQRALEIRDCHPDFVHVVVAERGRELRAGDRGIGGKAPGRGLILDVVDFVEELIDPDRQRERRLVERMHLEALRLRFARLGLLILLVPGGIGRAIFRLEKRIDRLGPLLAV